MLLVPRNVLVLLSVTTAFLIQRRARYAPMLGLYLNDSVVMLGTATA